MATIQEAREIIIQEYDRIWNDWFHCIQNVVQSKLDIRAIIAQSGYTSKDDTVHIFISGHDLDEFDYNFGTGYPTWRRELIHELLHLWQFKSGIEIMREGKKLFWVYERSGFGYGRFGYKERHNELFYSAIVDKAGYFNMTPVELINHI